MRSVLSSQLKRVQDVSLLIAEGILGALLLSNAPSQAPSGSGYISRADVSQLLYFEKICKLLQEAY